MLYAISLEREGVTYYSTPGPDTSTRLWTADINKASSFVTAERAEDVRVKYAPNGKVVRIED